MIGVYKITNPEGAVYVGGSKNIENRWKFYKYLPLGKQPKLSASFHKFGFTNHIFEVLEECELSVLRDRESYYGVLFNVVDPFNLNHFVPARENADKCTSQEFRDMMSKVHKGKTLKQYQIDALVASRKGVKHTKEHIEKRKVCGEKNGMYGRKGDLCPNYGVKYSEDRCREMSEQRKGTGLLGENGNAKKVINTKTGEIFNSAKEIAPLIGLKYKTFTAKLCGYNTNNTDYIYLKTTKQ